MLLCSSCSLLLEAYILSNRIFEQLQAWSQLHTPMQQRDQRPAQYAWHTARFSWRFCLIGSLWEIIGILKREEALRVFLSTSLLPPWRRGFLGPSVGCSIEGLRPETLKHICSSCIIVTWSNANHRYGFLGLDISTLLRSLYF